MTRPTSLEELAWLHDVTVTRLIFGITENGSRSIMLMMRAPYLGYAPWDGKMLTLNLLGVAACRFVAWEVAHAETIDAVRSGISPDFSNSTSDPRRAGISFPPLEFSISFHSGSAIEVICQELTIDVP